MPKKVVEALRSFSQTKRKTMQSLPSLIILKGLKMLKSRTGERPKCKILEFFIMSNSNY